MKKEETKRPAKIRSQKAVSMQYISKDLGLPDLDLKQFIGCGGHSQE